MAILAEVMVCCLTTSHYLHQCWLITKEVLRHLREGNFTGNAQDIHTWYGFEKLLIYTTALFHRGQWVQPPITYGPLNSLTLIPAWSSNHKPGTVWDEITYPFPNVNGATPKVWEWISNFILYCIMDVITHPCRDLSMKGVTSVDIDVWATRPTRNQQQRQGDMTISMNESWSLEKKTVIYF